MVEHLNMSLRQLACAIPKLTHAQIAILVNFYSVDVIVKFVWGKNGNFRLAFLEFPSVKFLKSWQVGYNKETDWTIPVFFLLKICI